MNDFFDYDLTKRTVVFSRTLKKNSPYIAKIPRDHESLFLVTNGSVLYENKGITTIINTGEIGYIPKGSIDKTSTYMCDEVSFIGVNFSFGEPIESTLPFNVLCSKGITYEYEQLFKNMHTQYLLRTPGYISVCNGILLQIIGYLYNEHTTNITKFKKIRSIKKSIEYLHENYHSSDLKISCLAELSYMSEKNFRRIFYDIYEKSPYAFLQAFRISKAKEFLTETDQSITGIAVSCGFCDVYSFSHCFKNHTGVSPMEYRFQNR